MDEFIDRAIGIKISLMGRVIGGQMSSVGEPGHLWRSYCCVGVYQRGLSRTTLEGSWWGLGFALPSAVGRGRPLRVAAPGLGAHGDSTPATAEPQGYLRLPGGAAGLQTIGACLGVPAEGSFHLHPCPRSPRPGFSRSFIRSHLASGANRVEAAGGNSSVGWARQGVAQDQLS